MGRFGFAEGVFQAASMGAIPLVPHRTKFHAAEEGSVGVRDAALFRCDRWNQLRAVSTLRGGGRGGRGAMFYSRNDTRRVWILLAAAVVCSSSI
jgi:hypothetical protein